jgi:pimeloyl-ACP methyl ester carboxylesterase
MYLVKRRFEREHGLRAALFDYPSVRGALDDNAAALADFVRAQDAPRIHLVGHSLGGVLAMRMYANFPDMPPGRIVCLASPLTGSRAARILAAKEWAEDIIGKSLPDGVVRGSASEWAQRVVGERDIGVIAGTVPVGLGRFVTRFEEPNDGTVAVSETRLPGARDHLVMRASHQGMLLSADVADQAAAFLKRGEFLRE